MKPSFPKLVLKEVMTDFQVLNTVWNQLWTKNVCVCVDFIVRDIFLLLKCLLKEEKLK